jgi:hypothetical protein
MILVAGMPVKSNPSMVRCKSAKKPLEPESTLHEPETGERGDRR